MDTDLLHCITCSLPLNVFQTTMHKLLVKNEWCIIYLNLHLTLFITAMYNVTGAAAGDEPTEKFHTTLQPPLGFTVLMHVPL